MHPFKKMILSKTHQNVSAGLSPIVFSEFTSYTVVPGQTQETSIYATFTINSGTHTFRGRAISYGSGLTISTTVIINGVTGLNLDNATSTPQNSSASITLSTPGTYTYFLRVQGSSGGSGSGAGSIDIFSVT
jgi:plastocyanin